MKKLLLLAMGIMAANTSWAQFYATSVKFDPTGVSDEGLSVGASDQNQPFYIWNPFQNTFKYIGGVSAGNGVGGVASFSHDGNLVSAPMYSDSIAVSNAWDKLTYADFSNMIFKQFAYMSDYNLYAVGTTADGDSGIIVRSANNGSTWRRNDYVIGATATNNLPAAGLTCMGVASDFKLYAGGHNGVLYYSNGNGSWSQVDIHPAGDQSAVDEYTAIDFDWDKNSSSVASHGVFGLKKTDGSYAVWQTSDTCKTFSEATGVEGVPTSITHVADTFYMVTDNGHIERSLDHGKTWTDIYTLSSGKGFYRIYFADANRGIALADNYVYITRDGGTTWTRTTVLPSINIDPAPAKAKAAGITTWRDVAWSDSTIMVVGNNGSVFRSKDNGKNFDIVRVDPATTNDYSAVFLDRHVYNIIGSNGNFYRKSDLTSESGYSAGVFNVADSAWTTLQSSGQSMQGVFSAPYRNSDDGKVVVGLAYFLNKNLNKIQAHAAVWNNAGIVDLGSKFADKNRASRANSVNADGSVIVGWQDVSGPWFASVWRRNADGTYKQTLLTKDSTVSDTDVDYTNSEDMCSKLLGACQTASADGKYIGGTGGTLYAVPGPWIWSKEEGLVQISDVSGCVSAISSDGTKAVGWYGSGQSAWIWIKGKGVFDLQSYAEDSLGADLGDYVISSVYDMSPNGRYLTGYCMSGMENRGYVLDLEGKSTGIGALHSNAFQAGICPDMKAGKVYVTVPDGEQAKCTLYDVTGHIMNRATANAIGNGIDVNGVPNGLYLLNVKTQNGQKTYKIEIKH